MGQGTHLQAPQRSGAVWLAGAPVCSTPVLVAVTVCTPRFLFMYPQGVTRALREGSQVNRAFRPSALPAQR